MTLQPFTLEVQGVHAAGLRAPQREGRRVLALHGWLDNAASFVPLAAQLPALDLVALDLPGHGHSAHLPPGTQYNTPGAICHVLDVADALGWDRFTLLGHSMGAGIASLTAAARRSGSSAWWRSKRSVACAVPKMKPRSVCATTCAPPVRCRAGTCGCLPTWPRRSAHG